MVVHLWLGFRASLVPACLSRDKRSGMSDTSPSVLIFYKRLFALGRPYATWARLLLREIQEKEREAQGPVSVDMSRRLEYW